MAIYKDKTGIDVKIGDILWYDEGKGFSKGIHVVVDYNGGLAGKTVIYNKVENVQHANKTSKWTLCHDDAPVELCFYTKGNGVLTDAEVIGNVDDNADMLTIEYVERTYKL